MNKILRVPGWKIIRGNWIKVPLLNSHYTVLKSQNHIPVSKNLSICDVVYLLPFQLWRLQTTDFGIQIFSVKCRSQGNLQILECSNNKTLKIQSELSIKTFAVYMNIQNCNTLSTVNIFLPFINKRSTQFSHSGCPQTLTNNLSEGFRYFVVLQRGQANSSIFESYSYNDGKHSNLFSCDDDNNAGMMFCFAPFK